MPRSPLAWLRRDGTVRRVGAFLAMLALMLQLGLPLAHDPIGLGTFEPWLGSALCHAGSGTADPSAPGKHQVPGGSSGYLCPICVSLQACGSVIAPQPGATVEMAAPMPPPLSPPRLRVRVAQTPGRTAQPRGPPIA